MSIVLLGYMASGKSTIAQLLADKLNFSHIDLDTYIEEQEAQTITNIISTKGEIYFRTLEHQCLNQIIKTKNQFVLSLGGGTPCYYDNMQFLLNKKDLLTIYLKVNISVLTHRLFKNKTNRPLVANINNKADMQTFIGKHLFERSSFYKQAHIEIDTSLLSIESIVEAIIFKLF